MGRKGGFGEATKGLGATAATGSAARPGAVGRIPGGAVAWVRGAILVAGLAGVLPGGGCTARPPADDTADIWRRRGESLEAAGRPDSALAVWREAARRFPTDAWPWAGVGRTAARLGRFPEALDAFETAVRWDSSRVEERVELARLTLAEGRATDALDWLDEAARRAPEDAARLSLRARILATAGRAGEARAAADRALALDPGDVGALATSAFCRLAADSVTLALTELDEAIRRAPADPRPHEDRAEALLALGDRDGAIAALERVLALDARRPAARRRLARLLVEAGRLPDAEMHFRRLLEDSPLDVVALDGLATCALGRGDRDSARGILEEAIRLDPEFAPAYFSLGRLAGSEGRHGEAVTAFRKARARSVTDLPRWTTYSVALGDTYLAMQEPANALDVAEAILERAPESLVGRSLRCRALLAGGAGAVSGSELERLAQDPAALPEEIRAWARWQLGHGNADHAVATLDPLVAAHPDDIRSRLMRAEALGRAGRTQGAERELRAILDTDSAPPEAYRALATLLLANGRPEEAERVAISGERLRPDDPEFVHLRGTAALERGDLRAAREAFERERDLRPDQPRGWIALGDVEMRLERPDSALPLFEQARALDPSDGAAWRHLARAEERAGHVARAIAAWREAIARGLDDIEAHLALTRLLLDSGADAAEAEAHARRAVELAPRDAMARYFLGLAWIRTDRVAEGRSELRRALGEDSRFERAAQARALLEQTAP